MQLDAAVEALVNVGDAVTITLPDNQNTPGRVTYVGAGEGDSNWAGLRRRSRSTRCRAIRPPRAARPGAGRGVDHDGERPQRAGRPRGRPARALRRRLRRRGGPAPACTGSSGSASGCSTTPTARCRCPGPAWPSERASWSERMSDSPRSTISPPARRRRRPRADDVSQGIPGRAAVIALRTSASSAFRASSSRSSGRRIGKVNAAPRDGHAGPPTAGASA